MRLKYCLVFVLLSSILFSCSPKSIKPPDSELYFSLEYIPKSEKFTDDSRFKYADRRVTDTFIPSGDYGQVIPYIGGLYHEFRHYYPVFGFVDAEGYVITDAIYPNLDTFALSDGTALFVAAFGYKDTVLIPQDGGWMLECVDYSRPRAYDNRLFGILNAEGDTVIYSADGVPQRTVEGTCVYYGDDLFIVAADTLDPVSVYRLMTPGGNPLNDDDTDYYFFNGFNSGYASLSIKTSPVKREYSAVVIDTSGNYVLGPTVYRQIDISTIDLGVLRVSDNKNQYGIIDTEGNELVPCQYPHLTIESASPLIFTTHNKRINYTDSTESDYESNTPAPDYGEYDYSAVICGYTCAVSGEYTYVFDARGQLLFKKLIHDTD